MDRALNAVCQPPPSTLPNPGLSIAFLSASVSSEAGGIFEVQCRLAQSLCQLPGVAIDVFGIADAGFVDDAPRWAPIPIHAFPYHGPQQFRWSPALRRAFLNCTADVGHLHVLWLHTSLIMRSWSRQRRKPFVTTLHGMLDGWALRNSAWKKRLSAAAYERSCLAQAACIHVFSRNELVSARAFGLKNPVCIIPNGVDLPQLLTEDRPWTNCLPQGRRVLLYLGRLHPKKGLSFLLQAWKELAVTEFAPIRDWCLVIAGWDQLGHQKHLASLAASLGISNDVFFTGPLFGQSKQAAYQHADAVVLPSSSEGLPMVVLEAWSHAKPVLMTPQCNLPEGFAVGAAISSEPNAESLAIGLKELLSASDRHRKEMGARGLELVERKFTWPKVAAEMYSVYSWLAGGGSPPRCVVGD